MAPTPEQATRRREVTVARLPERHRIRRLSAAEVLGNLRKPPLAVAPSTAAAAAAHIEAVSAPLRKRQPSPALR